MALQRKVKWLFASIVAANLIIVLVVVLGAFEPPPPKPLPNPNGYDDFVKAGNLVSDNASDWSTLKPEQLAALVATNTEALKIARIGLTRECRVPVVSNQFNTNFWDNYLNGLAEQKRLTCNFCAEGRLELLQGRTNEAAQSYMDAETFGLKCCEGGVIVSKLVGIACESLGRGGLQSTLNRLDAPTCRALAQKLETLDAEESSIDEVFNQEKLFLRKGGTIAQKLAALFMFRQRQKIEANFTAKFQKNQLGRRYLMIDFAARAYDLDKGKPPNSAADLVPDYLKGVPQDPVTGAPLGLRTQER